MKDSGNVFIGNIPQDWRLMRLKFCLAKPLRSGTTDDPMEYSPELPRYIRISDIDKDGNLRPDTKVAIPFERAKGYILEDDTVLFASCGGTVGKAFLYKKEMGFSTYASYLIAAQANSAKVLPEWIYYFSKSATYFEWLQCSFTQSTIQNINSTKYGNLPLAVPEVSVQKRIIAYLDRKCADIDNVLEKTKASIEEYRKLKQSVITEAVTKGVRGERIMKDSGIQWIGQIPETWQCYRITNLYEERAESGNPSLPILTVSINTGVSDHEIADEDCDRVFVRSEDRTKYKRVYPSDLAYNMMRAWQGAFGAVRVDGMVSPAYVVAKPKYDGMVDSRYIEALLRTPSAVEEMHRYSHGIADFRLRLYWPEFKNIRICVPPIEEQKEIADYIDEKASSIDSLISSKELFIMELETYRKSLIYEYVTGKKEVHE